MSLPKCNGCGNSTGQYTRVEDKIYCYSCANKFDTFNKQKEVRAKFIEFDINGIQKSTSTYKDEDYTTFKINIPQGLNFHIDRWGRKRRYRIHLLPIGE